MLRRATAVSETSWPHGRRIDVQIKFLGQLPAQCKSWIFLAFDLAAREFPLSRVRLASQRLL